MSDLPLADAPLARDGIVIDCDEALMRGRELQPDEVAAMRLKRYERRREAFLQITNDRIARRMSREANH